MKIDYLKIKNFRNIKSTELKFSDKLNVFVGPNGQGKTNILESIYYLIEGNSFRYSQNETLISFYEESAFINGFIHNNNLDYKINLQILKDKKIVLVNDKKTTQLNKILHHVVLFSPESLLVIKESAEHRRQLVDEFIASVLPEGRTVIEDFRKALKSRNRLLKDFKSGILTLKQVTETLESLNPLYLRAATRLTGLRIRALQELKPEVLLAHQKIEKLNNTDIDFQYCISDIDHKLSHAEKIYSIMQKRMEELASAELNSGVSLVGPQKHDVIFLYNGKDSRFFCSQGQQRSIILAYKMAQVVYHHRVHGFYPILLLDDVLSELDSTKQEALIWALKEIQTQTFLTTTDVEILKRLGLDQSLVFEVREGNIISI